MAALMPFTCFALGDKDLYGAVTAIGHAIALTRPREPLFRRTRLIR